MALLTPVLTFHKEVYTITENKGTDAMPTIYTKHHGYCLMWRKLDDKTAATTTYSGDGIKK